MWHDKMTHRVTKTDRLTMEMKLANEFKNVLIDHGGQFSQLGELCGQ